MAGLAVTLGRSDGVVPHVRAALEGYTAAGMAIHREVARWILGRCLGGAEGRSLVAATERWMAAEGVPAMAPLARALAPGVAGAGGG
jgi:hypothetical protein